MPPNNLLLISCSKTKRKAVGPIEASILYEGTLTRLGLLYASKYGLCPRILSAKYGFVSPTDLLDPYDQVLTRPWSGSYPEGSGFWVGGYLYFGKAPSRFQPLIAEPLSQGALAQKLSRLIDDKRKPAIGITGRIFEILCEGPISKDAIYQRLVAEFGNRPKMRATINCQCAQNRIGKERNCIVRKAGELYWVDFYKER